MQASVAAEIGEGTVQLAMPLNTARKSTQQILDQWLSEVISCFPFRK
jgi:hypothetical protein